MSIGPNPLNDISKVYLEAVAVKPDFLDLDRDGNKKEPMKKAVKEIEPPRERLKTDRNMFSIPKDEQQSAKDRLLAKARAKRAKMSEEKKNDGNLANNYPPYDKVTRGDVIAGRLGKDQMGGKKKVEESFSNWRQDLSEVMHDDEENKQIKEKEVNNKIIVNPKLGEAVEEIGGTLIEMIEIDEFDFVIEGVYNELLEEGYDEDDIEEAIEYALIEAKVTFGHDTAKKRREDGSMVGAVRRLARQKLSSKVREVKKSVKQAVASGARKVAKGAIGVARKMEGGDSKPSAAHTKTRKSSTYRGAGAGTKERVSSGSYNPPAKKKAEKPADPWEGSETTPPKAKSKKAAAPKAKAPTKKKKSSKLDDLLTSVRNEEVQIDEKITAKTDMGAAIKDFYASKSPQLAGRTKEERRKAAIAAVLTARRGGRKLGEQMNTEVPAAELSMDKKREMMNKQKFSNIKMLQQKKQQLDRQRLQMQKSGRLPLEAN